MAQPLRHCVVCGSPLIRRRSDARHCSGSCRAEASRIRAILRGEEPQGYSSVEDRVSARQKRTNWAKTTEHEAVAAENEANG